MVQCKRFTRVKSNPEIPSSFIQDDNIADRINEWAIDHPNIRITNVTVSLADEILVFFEEKDEVVNLKKELEEVQNILFEVFNQSCQSKYVHESKSFRYNNQRVSSYELAQDYLIKIRKITKEQCE